MHTRRIADQGWRSIRQQENARKRDAALRIPSRWAGGGPAYPTFLIGGGNLLLTVGATSLYGIKGTSTAVTEVPTASPSAINSYANGLGWGTVLGGTDLVWICTKTPDGEDLNTTLYNQYVTCRQHTTLPIATGGSAVVWLPWLA